MARSRRKQASAAFRLGSSNHVPLIFDAAVESVVLSADARLCIPIVDAKATKTSKSEYSTRSCPYSSCQSCVKKFFILLCPSEMCRSWRRPGVPPHALAASKSPTKLSCTDELKGLVYLRLKAISRRRRPATQATVNFSRQLMYAKLHTPAPNHRHPPREPGQPRPSLILTSCCCL
jgi:hypothetical protein